MSQKGSESVLLGDVRGTGRSDHMEGLALASYSLEWMQARAARGNLINVIYLKLTLNDHN